MNTLTCPSRDEMVAFLHGKLPDDRSQTIDSHLDTCLDCRATLETWNGPEDTLAAQLREGDSQEEFWDEPECQELLSRLEAIGRDPTLTTRKLVEQDGDDETAQESIGPYRLLEKLGAGGMGTVYKALHTRLKRVVALKVLPTERMRDPTAVARFEREMEAVGKLDHPNIVRATDAGDFDGSHFLVMEYVDGVDLGKLVRGHGPLPIAAACELIRQAAIGLEHAYEHALVHRDIKPSNLMLTRDGTVKVLDLGLALLEPSQTNAAHELTSTGQTMGTLDYMAPEQGGNSHDVDIRADIYSLGATLYKLLTCQAIYHGAKYQTNIQKLMALASQSAPLIQDRRPDVPDELVAIIHRMIAKDRDERFAAPAEVAAALAHFADGADLASLLAGAKTDPSTGVPSVTSTTSLRREASEHDTSPNVPPAEKPSPAQAASAAAPVAASSPAARRPRWRGPALFAVAGLPLLLLAAIFTFRTPQGTVEIELGDGVEADSVKVVLKRGGKVIEIADAEQGWTVRLRDGAYEVDLQGASDRFHLEKERVIVTRGESTLLRVTLRPTEVAEQPVASPAALRLADRLKQRLDLAPLPQPGQPISPAALVTEPEAIDGLRSWTLETPQHRGRINVCRISPDGATLATGGADATIRLWNVADRSPASILLGHDCPVQSLEWSADGSAILTAGGNEICLWDARTARLIRRLITHDLPYGRVGTVCAVWGPEEADVVTFNTGRVFSEGLLRFWDLRSGTPNRAIEGLALYSRVSQPLAVDLQRKRLITGSTTDPVRVWDAKSGAKLREWEHDSRLWAVAVSADGRLVAAGGARSNGKIELWDADTGAPAFPDAPIEHTRDVDSLALSPDGTRLAAASSSESTVHLWDARTGGALPGLTTPHAGVTSLCWSDDGALLVTAGWGDAAAALAFFDGKTGRRLGTVGGATPRFLTGVDWHPGEPRLAVGLREMTDNAIKSGVALWELQGETAKEDAFIPIASLGPNWSPDGRWLVDRRLEVYDVQARAARRPPTHDFSSYSSWYHRAFSSDGRHYAVMGQRGADKRRVVQLRELPEWNVVRELGDFSESASLDFSPDGARIAINSRSENGHTMTIVDVATGKVLGSREIKIPDGVGPVRWSPAGDYIAAATAWGVWVFHSETLERVFFLNPGFSVAGRIYGLVWLDGSQIAATSRGLVRIWDIDVSPAENAEHRRIHHSQSLTERPDGKIVFSRSPDGRHLASAAVDRFVEPRVSIWDWQAERVVATLILPSGSGVAPFPLAISAAGHHRSLGADADLPELVAVFQTDEGQQWLPLEEFSQRYGWKNAPMKAQFLPEADEAAGRIEDARVRDRSATEPLPDRDKPFVTQS